MNENTTEVFNARTARLRCKKYRVQHRVKLRELARKLKTPTGKLFLISNLCALENGAAGTWTPEFEANYMAAVDAVAGKF